MSLMIPTSRRRMLAGAASLLATPAGLAQVLLGAPSAANSLSSKPGTRLVVPFAPGGATDVLARALAERTQERLGPIVIDNRAGLRGSLGTESVARAAPDGSTLLLGTVITHAINPWLGASKLYDPVRDFTPITLLARMPNVLVVNADSARRLGLNSVADLIAYARQHPGKLSYGSTGIGSTGHLAAELLKARCNVFITHLPYAGINPALKGLLGGEVDLSFQNLASAAPGIKSGKLRALAVSTARRSSSMPELPTLAESAPGLGLDGFDVGIWFGLFGPARMTPALTARLNGIFTEALATPELRERLDTLKAEASPSTPEQLAALVKTDLQRHEQMSKRSGGRLDGMQ
ncbi:Bug family tripartite tricarboxylate transporter substrate binding protein [Roseateles violae]|uniref:Tripartite tricarboxylate transporter substrate binding protein n=1 Tax=Roseateles violae TaxID=3058042 RepID=A0ABT8DXX5_9BURK|nr:tripartite tricarboxylate transporter substrate binding protein [Pelomonas sp. PFR6]MDN3921839.1 tripartite tricarboxylate transporter substrate binding protein [Pelomonas sp. PFR6]